MPFYHAAIFPRARRGVGQVVAAALAVAFLAGVVALARPPAGQAAALPAGFQESVAIAGLNSPTTVKFSPDGRVFVGERSGVIKVFDSLTDPTPTVFADLRTQVYSFWDRAFTGLALDPAFPVRPYVYVAYAHNAVIGGTAPRWSDPDTGADICPNPPGATELGCVISGRLSRLTADGDKMVGSEQVLLEDWCQQFPSHGTGDLVFGADGALYMSAGDGASFTKRDTGEYGNPCGDPAGQGGALRSQDVRTPGDPTGLDGTILRIDPDTGEGLPGNPMADSGDANARRIVAHGVRNPLRMTVRPGTNEMWFGDVGWADWEEINRLVPSQNLTNFGWPCREGPLAQGDSLAAGSTLKPYKDLAACQGFTGYTNPHYPYFHRSAVVAGDGCRNSGSSSTTGVAFYNGGNYPAAYDGALFFADYSRRCIYAMPKGVNGLPDPNKRHVLVTDAATPVDLEIGPNGDLFYVDLAGGTIRRVRYYNGNQPPVAVATATPQRGPAPLTTTLSAAGSTDPEKGALSYAWDLDADGAFDDATGITVQRTFDDGAWPVRLEVRDPQGAIATTTIIVTAGNTEPLAVIDTPAAATTWSVNQKLTFTGHGTDAEDGTLPPTSLDWALVIQHCATVNRASCHAHPIQEWENTASASFDAPDHDYPSYLEMHLTATDAKGETTTVVRELSPRAVKLNARANYQGVQVAVDTHVATAGGPTVIAGSTHTVSAAAVQVVDGVRYEFAGWSDHGEASHDVTADGTALVATYRAETKLAASVSAGNVIRGTAITVTGRLLRGPYAVAGLNVTVYARGAWSTEAWVPVGTVKTDAGGYARLGQKPTRNTEYQVRFAGSGGHLPSQSVIVRTSVR